MENFAREGVSAETWAGGNLQSELENWNHRSALKYGEEVLNKATTDVAMGRTIVFPVTQAQEIKGLRISPVGVVEEKTKLRVMNDMTFGGQATVREGRRGGRHKAFSEPECRSVNDETDWQKIPECRIGE